MLEERPNLGPLRRLVILFTIILGVSASAAASDVAVKTNLLYDATATVNLGAEVAVAPKWSLEASGNFNAWRLGDRSIKHWMAQPGVRYWTCDAMAGHFFGANLIGGQFNFYNLDLPFSFLGSHFGKLKDYRYQGWCIGAGVSYGYSWALARHWSIEAEIGIGYIFARYSKYECRECGRKVEGPKTHNYFGPSKAALNLVYVF